VFVIIYSTDADGNVLSGWFYCCCFVA